MNVTMQPIVVGILGTVSLGQKKKTSGTGDQRKKSKPSSPQHC